MLIGPWILLRFYWYYSFLYRAIVFYGWEMAINLSRKRLRWLISKIRVFFEVNVTRFVLCLSILFSWKIDEFPVRGRSSIVKTVHRLLTFEDKNPLLHNQGCIELWIEFEAHSTQPIHIISSKIIPRYYTYLFFICTRISDLRNLKDVEGIDHVLRVLAVLTDLLILRSWT